MSDKETYKQFAAWLGKTWWELTESKERMPLIMTHFSPEEAAFLTDIPFSSKTLEEIAAIKEMVPDELISRLDDMARKGVIQPATG